MKTLFRHLRDVLRARAWLIGATAGACLLAGLAYGLLARDRYVAVATLFVDPSALDVGTLGAKTGKGDGPDLDLLRSERVAQRVVENEQLALDPGLQEIFLASIDGGKPPLEAVARSVAAQMDAKAGGEGGLVRLAVSAAEPQLAARIANAYAQAWGEVGLELHAASIRSGIERAYQDLMALRGRIGQARASSRAAQGGASLAAAGVDAQFALLSRLATRSLPDDRGGLAARDPAADLPAGMPEAERALLSPAPPAPAAASRSSADDEIRLAQQSLERAEDRLARLSAEGVGAPFPVHLLAPARVPETSIKPSLAQCAALGAGAGLLLGLLAAGLAERFDRRVRRPADVVRGLGVVVLGSLPAGPAAVNGHGPMLARVRPWSRAGAA
jgi:uncharacterized protein involved in exopolysaccharide biosynthesis